jgi:hypothetical protein
MSTCERSLTICCSLTIYIAVRRTWVAVQFANSKRVWTIYHIKNCWWGWTCCRNISCCQRTVGCSTCSRAWAFNITCRCTTLCKGRTSGWCEIIYTWICNMRSWFCWTSNLKICWNRAIAIQEKIIRATNSYLDFVCIFTVNHWVCIVSSRTIRKRALGASSQCNRMSWSSCNCIAYINKDIWSCSNSNFTIGGTLTVDIRIWGMRSI